jgi:phytoene synthase
MSQTGVAKFEAADGVGRRAGSQAVTSADAVRACRQTLARGSKSFALASRLIPPDVRDEAAVIYTWCRRADDAVDLAPSGEAASALEGLRLELDSVYAAAPVRARRAVTACAARGAFVGSGDAALAAFAEVVHRRRIPRRYPEELLAGLGMDVAGAHYRSLDELLLYGFRVAGAVGLMMCHVMGLRDDRALESAAHLGIAMQLTNICRDVAEDWARGRLYLPEDWLAAEDAADLRHRLGGPLPDHAHAPLARGTLRLLEHADGYYASGDCGMAALPTRCQVATRAARLIYAEIGTVIRTRLRAFGPGAMAERAVVPTGRKLVLVARAAVDVAALAPVRLTDLRRPRSPRAVLGAADVLPGVPQS